MGNAQKNDCGSIIIQTDKPYYFPGDTVHGNIYLNITKQGYPATMLILHLNGKEKLRWTEFKNSKAQINREESRKVYYTSINMEEKVHFDTKLCIHQFDSGNLQPGSYVFPFQFQLQQGLPGSFRYKNFQSKVKIRYSIKVNVETSMKEFQGLQQKQEFIVRERQLNQVNALAGISNEKVSTCFFDQGKIYMHCVFDKNQYQVGDVATIWIDVDNTQSEQDIKEFQVTLYHRLTLKKLDGKQIMLSKVINQQELKGIKQGFAATEQNRLIVQIPLSGPHDFTSSYGSIVTSSYDLGVEAKMGTLWFLSTKPHVFVPIHIAVPEPVQQSYMKANDWNLQVQNDNLI